MKDTGILFKQYFFKFHVLYNFILLCIKIWYVPHIRLTTFHIYFEPKIYYIDFYFAIFFFIIIIF